MMYNNLHTKIRTEWGKASKCELCGTLTAKRYEWSNKDHKYSLKPTDWWQLCSHCHRQYDRKNFPFDSWNKGKPIKTNNALSIYARTKGPWNLGCRKRTEIKCICGIKFYPPKPTSRFHSKHCAMIGNKRATAGRIDESVDMSAPFGDY